MKTTLRLLEIDSKGNLSLLPDVFTTDSEVAEYIKENKGMYSIIVVKESE